MCTLSWKPEPAGYRLWFNRDEQRARPPAAPPGMQRREGVPCLAPLDGAGGTWLLVDAHGMTLGLLNHYPDRLPVLPDAPRSRGLLPLACAGCGSVRAALACCAEQGLADYRPFRFVALSALEAATLTWDGREPRLSWLPSRGAMLTSSAWRPELVARSRQAAFAALVGPMAHATPERLDAFHRHRGADAAAGIRMARPDACTQSISRIDVSWHDDSARFQYEPQSESHAALARSTAILALWRRGHG